MSSLARAATSTILPMVAPSLVTTASPVLTAVHAICSSAMRPIIEPVQLHGLDGRGLPKDEQEQGLASEALGVMVHRDGASAPGDPQRRRGAERQVGRAGPLLGHRLGRG